MQTTNLTPVPQTTQVANHSAIQPILGAMKANNDKLPKTGLPTEDPGTIQENTHLISTPVTIYTEHGKIAQGPGNLIGRG
jgi:hypothetical protein